MAQTLQYPEPHFADPNRAAVLAKVYAKPPARMEKLRDAGRLSLDDAAGKYVPELARMPLPTRDAPAIRVRHPLAH